MRPFNPAIDPADTKFMNLLSERFFTLNSVQIYGRCSAEIACLFAVLLHEAMGRTILCVFSTRTICVNARDCWTEAFIISKSNKLLWTLCSETGRSSLKDKEKNVHSFKSPQIRESKTVLDSRFHTLDSGFLVLDSSLCQRNFGFWILIVSGISDS